MSISFIIPARNEEANIGKTIESILRQPKHLVKEIIVSDNGSDDNTAAVANSYPGVKVVYQPILGTNNARQKGFEAATGDIIAFVDADNQIPKHWSEKAIKLFSRKNVVGVSGPYIHRGQNWFKTFITNDAFLAVAYPVYFFVHYVLRVGSIVLGGNFAAKRAALIKVGGLDTRFRFFGDDVSTGKRLRKLGRVLFSHRLISFASARRFKKRGLFKTVFLYWINYIWVILFNRPFTK